MFQMYFCSGKDINSVKFTFASSRKFEINKIPAGYFVCLLAFKNESILPSPKAPFFIELTFVSL